MKMQGSGASLGSSSVQVRGSGASLGGSSVKRRGTGASSGSSAEPKPAVGSYIERKEISKIIVSGMAKM